MKYFRKFFMGVLSGFVLGFVMVWFCADSFLDGLLFILFVSLLFGLLSVFVSERTFELLIDSFSRWR